MGCSSEYKTVLRYPEFRKRFHRQILEGPVRKRDASCSLREWSKCQKVRFTFRRAALAHFIQQTIKNGL